MKKAIEIATLVYYAVWISVGILEIVQHFCP
mgnify:CR=1 FL=1